MRVSRLFLLSFVALCTGAFAQNYKPVTFTEFDLPNGLHVILHQDNSAPVVSTVLQYRTGSRYEDPARTGFAHFFEHLMFEGTDSIPRGQVGQMISGVGGEVNAFTSFDKTVYYFKVPSNALQLAMWIDAQRMRDLKIDTIGVETQRGVVKEERKGRYDNQPYGTWTERMFSKLFRGSMYSWTPIGSSQHIDVAAIKEFRDFYDKYYVPNNAVLCISGDFDPKEVREYIDVYYATRTRGADIQRETLKLEAMSGELREVVNDNKAQLPAVFVGYRGVAEGDPDSYAMSMLTDILANGESSRMYRSLVDEKQLAVQAAVFPFALEKTGAAILVGISAPGKDINAVEQEMYAQIDSVIARGVSDAEFKKAKNIAEAKFVQSKRGSLDMGMALADAYAMLGNTNYVNTEMERFNKVTREDLQRVAKKYFGTKDRVVMQFMPSSDKK